MVEPSGAHAHCNVATPTDMATPMLWSRRGYRALSSCWMASLLSSGPTASEDTIVIRLEVDDLCTFPQCSADLVYNFEMASPEGIVSLGTVLTNCDGVCVASCSKSLSPPVGQRRVHDITIESYSSRDTGQFKLPLAMLL